MKKTVLAVCAALTLVGLAAGCGSEEPGSTTGSGGQQQGGQQRSDDRDERSGDLELGDTAKLGGEERGSTFAVTVATFQDPSETVEERPVEGTRYVGARVEIENTGNAEVPYAEFDNSIELRTDDGRIYRPDSDLSTPAGGKQGTPEAIGPGDTVQRWVVFMIDDGKEPEQVGLSSASPFSTTEIHWDLD